VSPSALEIVKLAVMAFGGIMSALAGFVVLVGKRSLFRILEINKEQSAKLEAISSTVGTRVEELQRRVGELEQDQAVHHERITVLQKDLNGLGKKVVGLSAVHR
jgi:hypothetical protein